LPTQKQLGHEKKTLYTITCFSVEKEKLKDILSNKLKVINLRAIFYTTSDVDGIVVYFDRIKMTIE